MAPPRRRPASRVQRRRCNPPPREPPAGRAPPAGLEDSSRPREREAREQGGAGWIQQCGACWIELHSVKSEGVAAEVVPKGRGAAGFVQSDGAIVTDLIGSPRAWDRRGPAVTGGVLRPRAVLKRERYDDVVLCLLIIDPGEGRVTVLLGAACGDEGPNHLALRKLRRLPGSGERIVGALTLGRRAGTPRRNGQRSAGRRRLLELFDASDERLGLRVLLQG